MIYEGVKVIQALEKRKGLSVWLYAKVDDLPKYAKEWPTMLRDNWLEYHSPSAIDFWSWLRQVDTSPSSVRWSTIVNDKRKKVEKDITVGGLKVVENAVLETLTDLLKKPAFEKPNFGSSIGDYLDTSKMSVSELAARGLLKRGKDGTYIDTNG